MSDEVPSKDPLSDTVRQFTVQADDDGVRLDRWFKRHLPQIGFATVSRWARTGQIRVDGKRADPADRLTAGQKLRVPPGGDAPAKSPNARRELTEAQIEQAEAMVLTQDRAAIVLNKPPGLATQGGSGTKEHVDGLLDAYSADGPRPRLVHRLDKDTSGVLLIARTPGSAAFFSKRFSTRSARKIYWALIVGVPSIEDGLIDLPLAKQPGTGGEKMMVDESEHGQSARTRYRVLDRAGNRACWVELQPLTGRTHQLRVHMAAIGHPIVGDGKYGGPDAFLSGSISRKMHLHARRLIIDHPDGSPLDVTAPLPDHFAMGMEQLGFDEADGEALPEAPAKIPREADKTAAKAHAKQYRKERRGERRGRKSGERGPAGKTPGKTTAKPGAKPAGKPTGKPRPPAKAKAPARPATARTTAKPRTAKPGTGGPGKPR
jgi:23S rRNA pseudouridine955/2504/2580 synthase